MACRCIALYLAPMDPKALYTPFSHPPIHTHIHIPRKTHTGTERASAHSNNLGHCLIVLLFFRKLYRNLKTEYADNRFHLQPQWV